MHPHIAIGAAAPGSAAPETPQRDAPGAFGAADRAQHGEEQSVSILDQDASAGKRLSTCKARCALLGATLHELTGDDGRPEFVVTRWALTKAFRSLDELEQWLPRLEGRAP